MLALPLLIVVAAWIGWGFFKDWQQEQELRRRREERLAIQRRMLSIVPDSPSVFERFGDALRDLDDYAGAVDAYERALALAAQKDPTGSASMPGSGIENKLRLARLDQAMSADPARYGQTMRTRQQVCRTCGILGMPQDTVCRECGAQLPVDTMLDAWNNNVMRGEIVTEVLQAVAKLGLILLALFIASFLPWEVRGTLAIAAVIVIPMRLLKRLGDG